MTLTELRRSLAKKNFLPVYYLRGQDDFLIDKVVREIVQSIMGAEPDPFDYMVVDGPDLKALSIVDAANAYPLSAERKVLVVHKAESVIITDPFPSYLNSPSPTTSLVLIETVSEKKKSLGKKASTIVSKLDRSGALIKVSSLTERTVYKFIADEFARHGKHVTPDASLRLRELKGLSARSLTNEIEKICTAADDLREIDESLVRKLTGASMLFSIWDLPEATAVRNIPRALEISYRLLETNESNATQLVSTLVNHYIRLWNIHDVLSRRRGADDSFLEDWLFRKYSGQARQYTREQFSRIFNYLFEADYELKSRKTDERMLLTRLIYQITTT
ncbi:MAG: DNA polymerase III subunit delta [Chlorobi bacterium]|nr:DNA polymerase III subunit delta [Chlorobiota bacterium]